jgi:hypothetical protein
MSKPIIRIHNAETDEIIDREMTVAEFKIYEANQALEASHQAEIEAKATSRQALLERLGITEDEAKLLLS